MATVPPETDAARRPLAAALRPAASSTTCGVGFVADAGGGSRGRVIPLALAGLAALGHRGAFGADGTSSDGAGWRSPSTAPSSGC